MSLAGAVGALLFLVLGITELALANRSLYPSLRWRYEKAKTTQSQGLKPSTIMDNMAVILGKGKDRFKSANIEALKAGIDYFSQRGR